MARRPNPVERSITVRVTADMWRAIEIEAAESQARVSDVMRTAILSYLLAHQPCEFTTVDDEGHER